jgi:putative membrane protein
MKYAVLVGTVALSLSAVPAFAQQANPPAKPDAARQGAPKAEAAKAAADQRFMVEAAQGGMAEVELGKLAADKASNPDVKKFGERMVDDHGKANDELKTLAQNKNITLPTAIDARHKAVIDRLSKLSGDQFDRAYVQDMLRDHQKDVAAFRTESKSGKDADVKAWAGKTLPTLEEHLKLVQDLHKGPVGTSGTKAKNPKGKQ